MAKQIIIILIACLFIFSCEDGPELDTQTKGNIKVCVDDTYKPVMEQAFKVFQSRFPDVHIDLQYLPEADCINSFFEDTTRVIFVARELTEQEKKYGEQKQIVSRSLPLARDAVAFVVSQNAKRSDFSVQQIKDILEGKSQLGNYKIVFDHQKSSTVRFLVDSILKDRTLSANVFAANGSQDVVEYVSKNDMAIGVVGVPWIADVADTTTIEFLKKVQVVGLLTDSATNYIRPYQAYIGLKKYPFTRNLYFITKETWPGAGMGLINYLSRDGQIIFKQAKLFPLQVNVLLKDAIIKDN